MKNLRENSTQNCVRLELNALKLCEIIAKYVWSTLKFNAKYVRSTLKFNG